MMIHDLTNENIQVPFFCITELCSSFYLYLSDLFFGLSLKLGPKLFSGKEFFSPYPNDKVSIGFLHPIS